MTAIRGAAEDTIPTLLARAAEGDDAILIVDDRQHATVVDAADGATRRLLPAAEPDHGVAWSPDGRRILVLRGPAGDVWLTDADGVTADRILRDTQGVAWRPVP